VAPSTRHPTPKLLQSFLREAEEKKEDVVRNILNICACKEESVFEIVQQGINKGVLLYNNEGEDSSV
jgi:hypothetical protein